MFDFVEKTEDGQTVLPTVETAQVFNNYTTELENVVTSSGQTLGSDGSEPDLDTQQLAKGIVNYSGGSDFYNSSGTNTYILTSNSTVGFNGPPDYFDGMRVRFTPANDNTGASTVNVNSLGAKNVFNKGAALTGDEITGNVELVFDDDNDRFNLVSSGDTGIGGQGSVISLHGGDGFDITGSAASPKLNFSEMVTWTPSLSTLADGTATLSTAIGYVATMGNFIHATFDITVSSWPSTSVSSLILSGLSDALGGAQVNRMIGGAFFNVDISGSSLIVRPPLKLVGNGTNPVTMFFAAYGIRGDLVTVLSSEDVRTNGDTVAGYVRFLRSYAPS